MTGTMGRSLLFILFYCGIACVHCLRGIGHWAEYDRERVSHGVERYYTPVMSCIARTPKVFLMLFYLALDCE